MTAESLDFPAAAKAIAESDALVMACHVGPDGDALGSMLGMAVAASKVGKQVFPSFGPPFQLGQSYRFLPTDLLVAPGDVPDPPDLMLSFDSGNLERLGDMAGPASRAETLIVIDHHGAGSGGFGHINLVDPDAAATAELTLELIEQLGWEVDRQVATCLLTGLITDTGRFQYSNTRPSTLRAAARLVESGAQPDLIGRHIFEEAPFGYLRVAGAVMNRAELIPQARLVWSALYLSDFTGTGIGLVDTDPLIDLIRLPIESEAALLLKEHEPGVFKGSLRSRGLVNVGAVAVALGGGGHHNAAGFTFPSSAEQAVAAVVKLLSIDSPSKKIST